ncbi:MAG: peptide chain release factor N(5)-glutamine methyltransferase [Bacteroidota bacterium]|nr:peptide chain release factor N(5)-glutamine methyltransferase [Bacteroidota bacterium]
MMQPGEHTIRETLALIRQGLANRYPKSEVQGFIRIIFEHLLSYSQTDLVLKPEQLIPAATFDKINEIISRLQKNEPVQYILGETEFYGLRFKVNSHVLIPRPETEELVKWISDEVHPGGKTRILDIGTGSGCIAVALAKNIAGAEVDAIDVSEPALKVAAGNAALNKVNINFYYCDILKNQPFPSSSLFEVIVSNPPYVRESEKKLMLPNVLDYEPSLALFVPDEDPLRFYRAIAAFAWEHLVENGHLYFEINEALFDEISLLLKNLNFSGIKIRKDINEKCRMISCTKGNAI